MALPIFPGRPRIVFAVQRLSGGQSQAKKNLHISVQVLVLALPIFPGRPRIVLPYSDCPVDSRRQKKNLHISVQVLVLALPIFPVRSKYRFAVCNMLVACYRQIDTSIEKSPLFRVGLCWRYLSSRAVTRQVLSAQMSLTSVFGMGTGGPSPQSTPTSSIHCTEQGIYPEN